MRWRVPMVDLAADGREAAAAVQDAVARVLRSGAFVLGPETEAFEREVGARVGVRFAVGVGSGTEALYLALRALEIGPGDEVLTSAFTHFATVEAILLAGARPVFVDSEPGGFGIDPSRLAAAATPRTRAVIPVHLFGRCADAPRVAAWADAAGIAMLEDAAQAFGAARGGRRAGAWGRVGCFSFYPSKVLGAAGDGGCATTDDPALAERLRALRNHGAGPDGLHRLAGTTSRLDSLQAAVLRAKLPFLDGWLAGRARNAGLYAEELAGCPGVRLPDAGPGEVVVWSHYTLRCAQAPRVRAALASAGIETRHYYPQPAAAQPALGALRAPAGRFPEAERCCAEAVSLPVRPSCDPETIREVARVVRAAAAG
jgi:dTDP-4-amino-4,6-dideoxygalactose transaminase